MKRFWLLSLLVPWLLTACTHPTPPPDQAPPEETFRLQAESFTPVTEITGTLQAKNTIALRSKIPGRIANVFVDRGDFVKKGALLAQFSAENETAAVAHQNALLQEQAVQQSSRQQVQAQETALANTLLQRDQLQKEQDQQLLLVFRALKNQTRLTQTTLENALTWSDQLLGASDQFRFEVAPVRSQVGNQNAREKQQLQNLVQELLREESRLEEPTEFLSLNSLLAVSKKTATHGQDVRQLLQRLRDMIQASTVTQKLSLETRDRFFEQAANFLLEAEQSLTQLDQSQKIAQTQVEGRRLALVQAQNAIAQAESHLESTQAQAMEQRQTAASQTALTDTAQNEMQILAPFSGVITDRMAEIGQLVQAGSPLFSLADRSGLEVEVDFPDKQIGRLALGMPAEIKIDGFEGEVFEGILTRIDPAVDPQTRKIGGEITLTKPEKRLKLGLFARVRLVGSPEPAFFVPEQFLRHTTTGAEIVLTSKTSLPVSLGETRDGKRQIKHPQLKSGLTLLLP